jgi:hypothetical protein
MKTTIIADRRAKRVPDGAQPGWNDNQNGTNDPAPGESGSPRPACAPGSVSQPSTLNLQPFKNESDRAFEAFRAYWELGPSRRFAAVGRKVGASVRTVRRWASDFDWKGRIKSCSAQCAQEQMETENEIQRGELQDAALRAKAFRERQYYLAEAILDAAQRYLENMEADDMDAMSFADACKALEVASRLGQQAASRMADDPAATTRSLQDQLAALLDQAYGEVGGSTGPSEDPSPAARERVAEGQVRARGAC